MCMFDCGFIVLYEMIMLHLYISNYSIAVAMLFILFMFMLFHSSALKVPVVLSSLNTVSFHWTFSDESIVMGFH